MRRALGNPNLWLALCLWFSYWLIAPMIGRELLTDVVNVSFLAIGFAVLITYWPGFYRVLQRPFRKWDSAYYLVASAWCTTSALCGLIVMRMVRIYTDDLTWSGSLTVSWLHWIIITCLFVQLTSFNMEPGVIPPHNWKRAVITLLCAIAGMVLAWWTGLSFV